MKEFKSFYKTVEGNEGQKCHYPTRLDTYGCGCQHDCSYCYAKSLLNFRDLWNNTSPSVADITKIESKIKTLKRGTILRLGGMTDCFQPCEKQFKVTYKTIQLLNKYGIHYLIVTKSDLVASDEYVNIMDKTLAHIQITITSTDDNLALTYEKATPSSKRIIAIEKLEALEEPMHNKMMDMFRKFLHNEPPRYITSIIIYIIANVICSVNGFCVKVSICSRISEFGISHKHKNWDIPYSVHFGISQNGLCWDIPTLV